MYEWCACLRRFNIGLDRQWCQFSHVAFIAVCRNLDVYDTDDTVWSRICLGYSSDDHWAGGILSSRKMTIDPSLIACYPLVHLWRMLSSLWYSYGHHVQKSRLTFDIYCQEKSLFAGMLLKLRSGNSVSGLPGEKMAGSQCLEIIGIWPWWGRKFKTDSYNEDVQFFVGEEITTALTFQMVLERFYGWFPQSTEVWRLWINEVPLYSAIVEKSLDLFLVLFWLK